MENTVKIVVAFGVSRNGAEVGIIDSVELDLAVLRDEVEHMRYESRRCRTLAARTVLSELVAIVEGVEEHLEETS